MVVKVVALILQSSPTEMKGSKHSRLDKALWSMDGLHIEGKSLSRQCAHRLLSRSDGKEVWDSSSLRHFHALLISTGLHDLAPLADHLIRYFRSNGSLLEAALIFCIVSHPSVHTWHAIISAYNVLGQSVQVLDFYHVMQYENLQLNKFIYSCVLKACGDACELSHGKLIHEQILKDHVEVDAVMETTIIDMYAKCGELVVAWQVFTGMSTKNIIACNTLISGFIERGHYLSALKLFDELSRYKIKPTLVTLLCVLKASGNLGCLSRGELVHDLCIREGFEFDLSIGTALIDMYAKCKKLKAACNVFEALLTRNNISWNALIAGLCQQGYGHLAYEYFMRMQTDGINPDKVAFSSIFSACNSIRQGNFVYDQLVKSGMLIDLVIGNTLVDMYGTLGRIEDACRVFDRLERKNIVTWNALIHACVQHGFSDLAVVLFERMQDQGINPDNVTLPCILKVYSNSENLNQGRIFHCYILKHGYTQDVVVGNALVDMYAKCGSFEDASKIFDELAITRNIVTWNTIITGYLHHRQYHVIIKYFHKMLQENVQPDRVTFLCLIETCGRMGAADQGMVLHDWVINYGLQVDIAVSNILIDMYMKFGCLPEAHRVFDCMMCRDVMSWGAMISGYSQQECGSCAIRLFFEMKNEGPELNTVVFSCALNACGNMQNIHYGRLLHKDIILGNQGCNVNIVNALISMYVKCGYLEDASTLFAGFQKRDLTTWNVMIAGYSQIGLSHLALKLFKELLLQENLSPNDATFSCILNACLHTGAIEQSKLIHGQICERGFNNDAVIGNALVHMYSRGGLFEDAISVLDNIGYQDVVTWNALFGGLVEHGHGAVAIRFFKEMEEKGIRSDEVTFALILKACGIIGSLEQGRFVHEKIQESSVNVDSVVGNSLIDMYITCGALEEAWEVFSKLHDRNVVSYNAMISGFLQNRRLLSALKLFEKMQMEGVKADKVTHLCVLKATGTIGAVKLTNLIHDQVIRDGFDSDVVIGNTLVKVYAVCGTLEESQQVFSVLATRNVVSWASIISAYSLHGKDKLMNDCMKGMEQEGLRPVDVAFTSILSACSHAGKVEEGYNYFKMMIQYGIRPSIEHYNCMIQLLGQAGYLKEAEFMLQTIPIGADMCSWMTLLIACRCFGNSNMGKHCLYKATEMDSDITAGNVRLLNMLTEIQVEKIPVSAVGYWMLDNQKCSYSNVAIPQSPSRSYFAKEEKCRY